MVIPVIGVCSWVWWVEGIRLKEALGRKKWPSWAVKHEWELAKPARSAIWGVLTVNGGALTKAPKMRRLCGTHLFCKQRQIRVTSR